MLFRSHGFTLGELLIVVAIIGVLVSISIPVFSGRIEEAKRVTCLAERRTLKSEVLTAFLSGEYDSCKEAFDSLYKKEGTGCPQEGEYTAVYSNDLLVDIICSKHQSDDELNNNGTVNFMDDFYDAYSYALNGNVIKGGDSYREYFNDTVFKNRTVTFPSDVNTYSFSFNSNYSGDCGLFFANTYTDWHYKQYAQYIYNPTDKTWYHYAKEEGYSTGTLVNNKDAYSQFVAGLSSSSDWTAISGSPEIKTVS